MTIARFIGFCVPTIIFTFATPGFTQGTAKVGMLLPMTGPFTSTGKQLMVERIGGELYNVEFATIPNYKAPSKEKK